jgi:hypothetical protein
MTTKRKYSGAQLRIISAIKSGAKVVSYRGLKGQGCYRSEADGLRGVLYLTLSMRALVGSGDVYLDGKGVAFLSVRAAAAVG